MERLFPYLSAVGKAVVLSLWNVRVCTSAKHNRKLFAQIKWRYFTWTLSVFLMQNRIDWHRMTILLFHSSKIWLLRLFFVIRVHWSCVTFPSMNGFHITVSSTKQICKLQKSHSSFADDYDDDDFIIGINCVIYSVALFGFCIAIASQSEYPKNSPTKQTNKQEQRATTPKSDQKKGDVQATINFMLRNAYSSTVLQFGKCLLCAVLLSVYQFYDKNIHKKKCV